MQANGATNIGIIGINDLHGIEFTGRLQAELSARDMKVVVGPELYPLTVTDLSPIIKKLQEANVDTLWASTYPADGTLLVQQMMELGYSPKIMFMGPGCPVSIGDGADIRSSRSDGDHGIPRIRSGLLHVARLDGACRKIQGGSRRVAWRKHHSSLCEL